MGVLRFGQPKNCNAPYFTTVPVTTIFDNFLKRSALTDRRYGFILAGFIPERSEVLNSRTNQKVEGNAGHGSAADHVHWLDFSYTINYQSR